MPTKIYQELYIGGAWMPSASDQLIGSTNPSDGAVWAHLPAGNETDVAKAVNAAHEALTGPWGQTDSTERGLVLAELADMISANAEFLSEVESRDNGRPVTDTKRDVRKAADTMRFFAGAADKSGGRTIPLGDDRVCYTVAEPVGVVAAIVPWNSPISLACCKLGPALAMGNSVVLKPSELASASLLELTRLFATSTRLPTGVLNLVTGEGKSVGSALTHDPRVNRVTLTGSYATAAAVMSAASDSLARVTFECGGKSPHIVFADADLPAALRSATYAAFKATGQSCSLGSRLFVEESVYDDFVTEVARRADALVVGPALDPCAQLGPQVSAAQLRKTQHFMDLAHEQGRVLTTNTSAAPAGYEGGFYVRPTVVADLALDSEVCQEEIFGPVLAVHKFRDEDEVLEAANGVAYGLAAGVWTNDVSRAHRLSRRLRAGLVSVNCYRPVSPLIPYGGMKRSGLGRENGLEGLREYAELKTIVLDLAPGTRVTPFDSIAD